MKIIATVEPKRRRKNVLLAAAKPKRRRGRVLLALVDPEKKKRKLERLVIWSRFMFLLLERQF